MRGYQKRVVYLKNPGSAIFEEAYFVIKDDLSYGESEKSIIDEANRIIKENSVSTVRGKRRGWIKGFILPFTIGITVGFATLLFIIMLT